VRVGIRTLCLIFLFIPIAGIAQPPEKEGKLCQFSPDILKTRPDPEGTATPVKIGVYLMDIDGIDDRRETFDGDLFLAMEWTNPELAYSLPEGVSVLCKVPLNQVWNPRAIIFNQRKVWQQMPEQVQIMPDGTVKYIQRLYGTFGASHDFKDFPQDVQKLPIDVISRADPGEVSFVLDDRFNRQDEGASIVDWLIFPQEATVGVRQINIEGKDFPYFEFVLLARRHYGFYLWKVMVPLAVITFMAWTVFWIPPTFRVVKVSLSATAMLTTIAFQLALVHLLPRVSYLTKMDKYILTCTFFVFLTLLETVLSTVLAAGSEKREALANRFDFHARWIFPPLFLGYVFFILFR